jgi:Cep192 domain 4/NHL repeat/Abnormal spindle-like microcephaly-assoc'd, ASPM-SPD-2-Hydin
MNHQSIVDTPQAVLSHRNVTLGFAWRRIAIAIAVALFVISAAAGAFASQLVVNSSGGTATLGSDFTLTGASVSSPAGTMSLDCPITSVASGTYAITYYCSGGSFTYQSSDGTTSVAAPFGSASLVLTASGGGRGGNIHYYYSFSGKFSGTETLNGVVGAIKGETNAYVGPLTSKLGSATACCAYTGVNSAYTPVYITNYSFSQLVKADDLWGTNQQTLGGTGTGVKQFYGPHGLTVDSAGRIYVADTYNCRIDRMDDITGANWTTLGTCGSGANQFSTGGLADLAVDSSGRIFVADPGNGRIDRFDDMTGTNWTTFGTPGSGTNQLSGAQGVAIDSSGRIYIADAGNKRIVRIDDMSGTNWVALTQSPPIGPYIYSFGSPAHVAIDPTGRIEVGDGNNVIRVDDMTGANWVSTNTGSAVQGLSVDNSGTTFIANTYSLAMLDDVGTGAGFNTSNFVSQAGGIFAVPVPSPVPAVTIAPSTLTFASQNTGTVSAAQNVVLTNFGEAPLDISNIAASADFLQTDNCGPSLTAGSNCTIGVSYAPTTTGTKIGTVTITDNSFTGTQTVALSGTATAPIAGIAPAALSYQPQAINTTSGPQFVFLSNTGNGALTFSGSGIATTGDFAETNNCGAALAPQTSCTITVTYTPTVTGAETGSVTVTSNAAPQTVSLSGTGAATAPLVTASPESLIFSTELLKLRSAAQTVTLKNAGTKAVSITSITISGDFSKAGNCGTLLGAGKSCIENVYFTPTVVGTRSGVLAFNVSSGAVTVDLSGTGSTATALLTVSPTSLAFNGYTVGDNPDQKVTISNLDGVPAGIRLITKTGSTAFTFTKTCGTSLAAGASCTVDVTFIPTAVASYSGTLYVYEYAGAVHKIPLSGTGVTGN